MRNITELFSRRTAPLFGQVGITVPAAVRWMINTVFMAVMAMVITTINSFQCFALIQLLTSGGPNYATETVMYYIYYTAFKLYRFGYGNAMGVILAIFIGILSAIQFRLAREK